MALTVLRSLANVSTAACSSGSSGIVPAARRQYIRAAASPSATSASGTAHIFSDPKSRLSVVMPGAGGGPPARSAGVGTSGGLGRCSGPPCSRENDATSWKITVSPCRASTCRLL